jgi:hypothetical protein
MAGNLGGAVLKPCPEEGLLAALVESSLPPSEAVTVRDHLDGCDDCQEVVVALVKARRDSGALTPDVEPPSRIGPFQVKSLIGKGGMGRVYRVHDERLHRDVAVKVLPAHVENDPEWLNRFEREARAIGQLAHPNILAVHDVGHHQGAPYVVTELLEGGTLRAALRAPIPLRRAVEIAADVAAGLAAAHDKRIVHRDLKPENVFLTTDGRVKILDFGLAKYHESKTDEKGELHVTEPGVVLGTLGYMAPEQVLGRPADPRADLFSLGIVFHEMLAGRPPFRGTDAERMSGILRDDPPPLPDTVPPEIARVVRRLLEKDPLARFQSARDLHLDLRDLVTGVLTTARRKRVAVRLPRRWPVLLAVCAAASMAVGAVVAIALRRAPPPPRLPGLDRVTFTTAAVGQIRFVNGGQSFVFSPRDLDGGLYLGLMGAPTSSRIADKGLLLSVSPRGELAFLHDSKTFSAGHGYKGVLARMNLAGGAARDVADSVSWAAWTPDGTDLAYAQVNESGMALMLAGHPLHQTSRWVGPFAFSPDGKQLAVLEFDSSFSSFGDLLILDRQGNARPLLREVRFSGAVAWTPDGQAIYYTREDEDHALHRIDLDGNDRAILTSADTLRVQDVARDGRIVVTRELSWMHEIAHRPGTDVERDLVRVDNEAVSDLSQDGKLIAVGVEAQGTSTVYLRASDGSATTPVGNGYFAAISQTGKWIVALDTTDDSRILVYPGGGGAARTLVVEGLTKIAGLSFLPGEDDVLFAAVEPGQRSRLYRVSLSTGPPPAPVTDFGVGLWPTPRAVSPDGDWIVGFDADQRAMLYPLYVKGEAHAVPGMRPDEIVVGWTADSASVFVMRAPASPYVDLVDIATGARAPFEPIVRELGGRSAFRVHITPDRQGWTYTIAQLNSDAFLVTP